MFSICPFSFATESQLVVDASVQVVYRAVGAAIDANATRELLWPARHKLTLPINGLNGLFKQCEVSVNHHTKLDSDR